MRGPHLTLPVPRRCNFPSGCGAGNYMYVFQSKVVRTTVKGHVPMGTYLGLHGIMIPVCITTRERSHSNTDALHVYIQLGMRLGNWQIYMYMYTVECAVILTKAVTRDT